MPRSIVLALWFASLAMPQFSPMAANADGSALMFATNLSLKNEPPGQSATRIFLHGETPILQPYTFPDSRVISAPFISSDGQTTGYTAFYPCLGSCMGGLPRNLLMLRRNSKEHLFQAYSFLTSRNGRFVLTGNLGLTPNNLQDLDTGTIISSAGALSIADDGTTLSVSNNQLLLTPFAKRPQVIFEVAGIREGLLSPNAASAYIQTSSSLIHIDTATGNAQTLLDGLTAIVPLSSDDTGSRLLLRRNSEVLLWDRSTGWRSLFTHDERFDFSLLTGNGETVFAKTGANRIYRIDANTGEATQLYAPFPSFLRGLGGSTIPGSLFRYSTDYSGDELEIQVDSQRFPKIKSEPGFLDVQVPWESTDLKGRTRLLEIQSPHSPFALRANITFADRPAPAVFTDFRTQRIIATNQDFSQFITPENPARPGALIHFWAAGLGPLDQPVPTGMVGPADPPSRPIEPVACYIFRNGQNPRGLQIPTLIYAPNLVGLYQFDVLIPEDWPTGVSNIYCKGGADFGSGGEVFIGAGA